MEQEVLLVVFSPGTEQTLAAAFEPALHRMSGDVTLVTGLLLPGSLAQVVPWSAPSTHSCWKVAWPTTEVARVEIATASEEVFIFTVSL